MNKSPRFTLWLIILLTAAAIIIQLPLNPELRFRKGLDLEGGTSITLKADMKNISPSLRDSALDSAKSVLERRTNAFGVSEGIVQTAKSDEDYRILVEFPGISYEQAVSLVAAVGKLEFREVIVATNSAVIPYENTKATNLTGADLKDSQPSFDPNTGGPVVLFRVQDQSMEKFAKTTQSLVGRQMAIYLDKQFISAPVVQSSIRDSGQITGNFTQEGTKELAKILNAGALPVPLSELGHRTIGPTLGLESLKKSFLAGTLGFVIIVVFMSVLYKKLGIIASVALSLYVLIVLSLFKISSITPYGITLTLSGIAGFILSIGMAVDANILIFERMREEEKRGADRNIAVELGFSKAFPSIRDSNISTLITSAVLYQFGTGPVKGFALVLALGVLVSMFSAIFVTKTFLRFIYK